MNENMPSRRELLEWINVVSFAVNEASLYLDTHPDDREALMYFREYSKLRDKALREYARCFSPLTIDTAAVSCEDYWNWIDEPWPWQEGGCF